MNKHLAPLNALRTHWSGLAPRERLALRLAASALGLALIWWLLLAPALHTLRQAPAQHAALDQQLQQMQRLQAEALRLQSQLPAPDASGALSTPDIPRSLQESAKELLGPGAQLTLQGERAQLTLNGAAAHSLALWLAQTRQNLKVSVVEMRLTATQPASPTRPNAAPLWSGNLLLSLPAAETRQ